MTCYHARYPYIPSVEHLQLQAPAKVNLALRIIGERPDGYTEIQSVVQTVSLFDDIVIERAKSGLTLTSNDASIPLDDSNTVARAWAVLCHVTGSELGCRIHIRKRIPAQSGLGGGSSDAATTLYGLSKFFDLDIDNETLAKLGAAIGSDVPLFFSSGTSIISGRGEIVDEIHYDKSFALLIVKPPYGMHTARAYALAKNALTNRVAENILTSLNSSISALQICRAGNDLESVFLNEFPAAIEIKEKLVEAGAKYAALTGSGSAFFGFFTNKKAATVAGNKFTSLWHKPVVPVAARFEPV